MKYFYLFSGIVWLMAWGMGVDTSGLNTRTDFALIYFAIFYLLRKADR